VAGKEKERDWDREMREVDKLLAKLPDADPTLGRGVPTVPGLFRQQVAPGAPGAPGSLARGREWLSTWTRVGLGVLLGIGMMAWPYTHGCGLKLIFYLIGVSTLIVAGVWSSLSSWRRRLSIAHLLSQLLIIWGLVLAAREVLPRVGYTKVAAPFFCPEP
jgi:hypothetical protein